jgi:hypothetical protein
MDIGDPKAMTKTAQAFRDLRADDTTTIQTSSDDPQCVLAGGKKKIMAFKPTGRLVFMVNRFNNGSVIKAKQRPEETSDSSSSSGSSSEGGVTKQEDSNSEDSDGSVREAEEEESSESSSDDDGDVSETETEDSFPMYHGGNSTHI